MLLRTSLIAALPVVVWCFRQSKPISTSTFQDTYFGGQSFPPRPSRDSQLWGVKGFSDKKSNKSGDDKNLKKIYSEPALYELAMGYRNYENELEFLLDSHERFSGQKSRPKSVIEVASGPGRHCIEAVKLDMVEHAFALDWSTEMVEYGTELAQEELGDKLSRFDFLCDDMRTFTLGDRLCDSAWILAGSLQHMTTNDDVIASLSSIHKALVPQGTLILELPHPNEIFKMVDSTTNSWQVPLEDDEGKEYGQLHVVWGDEDDDIDTVQQIRQNTVVLQLQGVKDAEKQSVNGVIPLKLFTAQEIALFARCTGFEVAAMYGALSDEFDVNDEDVAYRMVCILRKM